MKPIFLTLIFCLGNFNVSKAQILVNLTVENPKMHGSWMGVGLSISKKGRNILISSGERNSPIDNSSDFTLALVYQTYITRVYNEGRGIYLDVKSNTTIDEVLNALVGPAGSSVVISCKSKGPGKKLETRIHIGSYEDTNYSSAQELNYLRKHFPDSMAPRFFPSDIDLDGVPDYRDSCKHRYGSAKNNGCDLFDDRDNDGLKNDLDSCPDRTGPGENRGCPWPTYAELMDADGDDVWGVEDECPDDAGPKASKGCPIDSAFDQWLFCKNLKELTWGFEHNFEYQKGTLLSEEDSIQVYSVQLPLPGMNDQVIQSLGGSFEYAAYYSEDDTLGDALLYYNVFMEYMGKCQLSPGTFYRYDTLVNGTPIAVWFIRDHENVLSELFEHFQMQVGVVESGETEEKQKLFSVIFRIYYVE